jgi:lantibiotic biosynthesis protein
MATTELRDGGATRWAVALDSDRGSAAIAVARDVAARATDPERLNTAIEAASRQTDFPEAFGWTPFAVAEGDAGLALMCGYLDDCLPGEGWDRTAHRFLSRAVHGAESAPSLPLGIFSGLSGLAFVAAALSRAGTRYQRLLDGLEDALLLRTPALIEATRQARSGIAVSQFDAISGLSGVGAYLLLRRERAPVRAMLEVVLSTLVALAEPDDGVPRWHTPPHLMADEAMAREYPTGTLNCGLAHGIPGPLALMALALRDGVEVPGQRDAMRRICDWLAQHRADDEWGVNWPSAAPVQSGPAAERPRAAVRPTRSAWCYGSPGVARAVWLAGEALGEPALCSLAVEALEAVYRRPNHARNIDSPTFCHGVAGLLQITLRLGNDTGRPAFARAAGDLVEQLLAAYQPDRLLGYGSLEPRGNWVDRPGLLDGASGVAMALLSAATDVEPAWDRLFLIA